MLAALFYRSRKLADAIASASLSILLAFLLSQAAEARNVALVIGNANYKLGVLKNPKRDAAAVADRLKDLGFEVSEVFDGDAFSMNRAAANFLREADGADLALFYFAGHGIQLFDRNFLLARDVDTLSVSNATDLGIDLSDFMRRLRSSGAVRHALFIDACRDNPLSFDETVDLVKRLAGPQANASTGGTQRPSRGLASVQIPQPAGSRGNSETLVFFAAQPGAVSYDGDGQNSFFVEGIKDGLSQAGRPLADVLRHASAYVRAVTNGAQVPQVVSDWTGDVTLGAVRAAKVTYNISPNDDKRPLSKKDEELLIRSVSGYKLFDGDFIARASEAPVDLSDLTNEEKTKAQSLGSINGFSIAYDLDRDGRDEIIHVYFRQTAYVMVIEKDGVRVQVDNCFAPSREDITKIEVALKDINGDRRPEIWIGYAQEGSWSTFCILEYKGIANLDKYRRGNTGLMQGGTSVFHTLLRAGGGWTVSVGIDNSIKICAGSNCHSPAAYTFDGEAFRMQYSELGSEPELLRNVPFHDESERAKIVYDAYRKAVVRQSAGNFQTSLRDNGQTVEVMAAVGGVEFGYTCGLRGESDPSESILMRWPAALAGKTIYSLPDAFAYEESARAVPAIVGGEGCVAESILDGNNAITLTFDRDTAARCIPRLSGASSVTLPVAANERGLVEIDLTQSKGREKIAAARSNCYSGTVAGIKSDGGQPAQTVSLPEAGAIGSAASGRFIGFAREYLVSSVPYTASINYYNQVRTRDFVAAEKKKYFARWPIHSYTLDPATVKVTTQNGRTNVREIEFEYDFKVANGSDIRAGRGVTRLVVEEDAGGTLRVSAEDGKVLRRF